MVRLSNPADYDEHTINIRCDLWELMVAEAEDEDIGVSRVLEDILKIAFWGKITVPSQSYPTHNKE